MTIESNPHPLDDLAVYALDAVDPHERAEIEAHLAGCATCRAELDRHLDTLAQLTVAEEPPADLWDRIAGQLPATGAPGTADLGEASRPPVPTLPDRPSPAEPPTAPGTGPGDVVPIEAARPRHRARSRRAWASPTGWLTAAAAAVVLVLGVAVVSLRSTGSDTDVADLALAAADDPSSTVVELTSADGEPQARVVVTDDGEGYVLLDELPTLPEGQRYQLWKMNGTGDPVSLGVIGDGSADAAAVAVPADSTAFAISEEVAEGVPSPQGPIVADGEQQV